MLNSNLLRGKIAESGLTQGELAKKIGISDTTLTRKMSGKADFTIGEIDKICAVLNIHSGQTKIQIFLA